MGSENYCETTCMFEGQPIRAYVGVGVRTIEKLLSVAVRPVGTKFPHEKRDWPAALTTKGLQ